MYMYSHSILLYNIASYMYKYIARWSCMVLSCTALSRV